MRSACAFLFLTTGLALAQMPAPSQEVVTFTFHNPQLDPADYSFQVTRDCTASYTAKPKQQEAAKDEDSDSTSDTVSETQAAKEQDEHRDVRFSDATCNSVFDLAKALGYFKGDFEFRKHKVAYTGDRTLGYSAAGVNNKTSFTWSENPQVQQLAATFEGISSTLAAEPKLKYMRRYDRLGLNEALKKMEAQAQNGWLKELQLIAPVLQSIADDGQIMNIARERARHLLQMAQTPKASTAKK